MTPETAAAAARWWAEQLQLVDKREAFRAALERRLLAGPDGREDFRLFVKLRVDYDPSPTLLAALREVGIECRWMMFSAEGLLPTKTEMHVWRDDGTVEFFVYRRGFRALVPSRTPGYEWIAGPRPPVPEPVPRVASPLVAQREPARITARVFWRDGSSSLIDVPADIAQSSVYVCLDPRHRPVALKITNASRRLPVIEFRTVALRRIRLRYPADLHGPIESDDVYVFGPPGPYSRAPYEGWREVGVLVEDGAPWLERWRP